MRYRQLLGLVPAIASIHTTRQTRAKARARRSASGRRQPPEPGFNGGSKWNNLPKTVVALTTIVTFGFFTQYEEQSTLAQFDEVELVESQRTAAGLALSDWIAGIDARDASPATMRFVVRSAGALPPMHASARMIGSTLAWRSSHAGLRARWRQYLTWGWDRPADGTDVVVVDHVGDVAAYLCGAGLTAACEVTTHFLLPHTDAPPRLLEYGSVRDVIVDHPGVAASRGRFVALAVARREPRSAAELADLVLLGQSNPDPALSRDDDETVVAVTDTAAETGATGALEVSLDAAWVAANRLAGSDVGFDRYVAITNAVDESVLRTGDRVLLLDGVPVGRGMFMAIAGDPASDSWFTVIRGNSRISIRTADVRPTEVRILEAARTTTERPAMVVRSTTRGPSAGIVSALAYLDAITPGDLTAGLTIAGTGTVTPHGYIGNVGGVASKTAAAVEAGADVLFVPPDNLEEATFAAAGDLEVVPIQSVEDALEWLIARR